MTKGMGTEEVITAPRSPWQNPYVERLIGSIRRYVWTMSIVWNRRTLRRILQSYCPNSAFRPVIHSFYGCMTFWRGTGQ
jgi:hypothetical protein